MSMPKMTRKQIQSLRSQFIVPLRDLAMRLMDDPTEADAIARACFRSLRKVEQGTVGTGAEAEAWLTEVVIDMCIRRFGKMVERASGTGRRNRSAA